jgi:hypothetical protein
MIPSIIPYRVHSSERIDLLQYHSATGIYIRRGYVLYSYTTLTRTFFLLLLLTMLVAPAKMLHDRDARELFHDKRARVRVARPLTEAFLALLV